MEYCLYRYKPDKSCIEEIRSEISRCVDEAVSEEWFCHRFEQNPMGKAIIGCAIDGQRLAALVIAERVPLLYDGKLIVGGCIRNVSLLPGYDNSTLLSGLMGVIQNAAIDEGIGIIYSFEESLSYHLLDFSGWKCVQNPVRFRLKSIKTLKSIFKLVDMEQSFVPFTHFTLTDDVKSFENKHSEVSGGSPDAIMNYLHWLSDTSLDGRFVQIETDKFYAMLVMGSRGERVWEAHITYLASKSKGGSVSDRYQELLGQIRKIKGMDVISCLEDCPYVPEEDSLTTTQSCPLCYKVLTDVTDADRATIVNALARLLYF